jgi:hypothetical protein
MSLEPLTTAETPHKDRLEAAAKMVCNHEAIVRFAARGAGKKGSRPVRAPLADPTATPAEDLLGVCVLRACVRVTSVKRGEHDERAGSESLATRLRRS